MPEEQELQSIDVVRDFTFALLGMMLKDNSTIPLALPPLRKCSLDPYAHIIMEIIEDYNSNSKRVDLNVIASEILRRGKVADFGNPEKARDYLFTCDASALEDTSMVTTYLSAIEREYRVRNLTCICQEGLMKAASADADPDAIEGALRSALDGNATHITDGLETGQDLFDACFPQLVKVQEHKIAIPAVTTTFPRLDKYMGGGMFDGESTTITAPSNGGKTTFALDIVRALSLEHDLNTAIISAEMTRLQLFQKLLSSIFKIGLDRVRQGHIPSVVDDYTQEELECDPYTWDDIQDIVANKRDTEYFSRIKNLHIFHKGSMTVGEAINAMWRAKARSEAHGKPLRLWVVDYIQLLIPDMLKNDNREQQVASMARRLIATAKDAGVHLMLLCQVNDDGQVRESRAIYHHTDSMLYLEPLKNYVTRVEIRKGRMHRKGIPPIDLQFYGSIGHYRELGTNEAKSSPEDTHLTGTINDVVGQIFGSEED